MSIRKFSELRDQITEDPVRAKRLAQAEERARHEYQAFQANLAQLRRARSLTQKQLGSYLGISQPEVSRIENQADAYLSTLRSYVEAMGGHLELVAEFDQGLSFQLKLGDVLDKEGEEQLPKTWFFIDSSREHAAFDIPDNLAVPAIRGHDRIAIFISIGTTLRDQGSTDLACLFFALAAECVAEQTDKESAAKEFGRAGALAKSRHRSKVAEALWRRSLEFDPTNIRSRSCLGQLLHHQGLYEEAIEHLSTVATIDNYAANFLGWSYLHLGLESDDDSTVQKGIEELTNALRRWCLNAPPTERGAWLRQVRRLAALGARFSSDVEQLIAFANSNANWGKVALQDIIDADDESIESGLEEDQEASSTESITS